MKNLSMMKHFRNHKQEYGVFLILALLVSVVTYKKFFANADITPTFVKDITYTGGLAATTTPSFYGTVWGVATDSSGNVYFTNKKSIVKVSPTGERLLTIASGAATSSFNDLTGIDVDASGNIYVIDYGATAYTGIKKFDSSGNLIGFHNTGWLNGIAVTASGTIYTTISGSAPIKVYDASLNLVTELTLSEPLGTWHPGIDRDSAGLIYVADYNNSKVKKFNASSTVVLSFGSAGSSTSQFINLSGIAVASDGSIYASDQYLGGRVQKFDASGAFVLAFQLPHTDGYPIGMSVDPSGNLWVANSKYLYKYDASGVLLLTISSGTGPKVGVYTFYPYAAVQDSQGNLFVSDDYYGGVLKFNANGDYLTKFGGYGTSSDQFEWPNAIAIDAQDNVYVSDCGTGVKKFSNEGIYLSKIGTGGTGDGQFNCPGGIAFDTLGNLYIADDKYNGYSRIQKFDASGNFVSKFGSMGTGDGQFKWINGMFIDSSNNIYITDPYNYRVQKFDASGKFLMKFGTQGTGNGQFTWSGGITVDQVGNIYVGDWQSRVQKFDPNGNFLRSITSAGSIPFISPQGVYIDRTGKLNILDYDAGRIAIFSIPSPTPSSTSTATSTTITWTTDVPTSTQLEFGPSTSYGSTTPITDISPRVTSHTVTLTELADCTLYNYRVKSGSATFATTTSSNSTFTTLGCTGMASTTASTASTASTTATSTVTLSTISISVPPDFATTTVATTTFQAIKLEPVAFFASTSVPTGTQSVSNDVYHLTALTDATTTLSTFTAPISITISYDPLTLSSTINLSTLKIYRYDDGAWNVLSNCTRDTTLHTVTCFTSDFSDFALFGNPNTSTTVLGGSGYQQPDGSLSSTPPATSGGAIPSPATTTTPEEPTPPTPLPVIVPKPVTTTLPRSTTTKPVVKATTISIPKPNPTKATSTIKITPPLPTSPTLVPVQPTVNLPVQVELPKVRIPRNFLDIISLKVYEGVQGLFCTLGNCK